MKLRYILIASLFCLIAAIFTIGHNANNSQKLAQEVLVLDNAHKPLAEAKQELADYVQAHMGSSITVFLDASYNQAVQAAANANPTSAGQVYQEAQAACVSRTSAVVQSSCVQSYLASHSVAATPAAPEIDKASYTLSYDAPRWTPDLAGCLLAIAGLGLITCAGLWLGRRR